MKITHLFLGLIFLNSCEYKEVEADAKSYCACKEQEYSGQTSDGECQKLLANLKKKYEYLPEQQELLVLKIADCMAEE
jgi:hypothetical protein